MTTIATEGALLLTLLQFAVGIAAAFAGYFLTGFVHEVRSRRRAKRSGKPHERNL